VVVASELERNDLLQLYHPYTIEVLDTVPPARLPRLPGMGERFSLPAEGYDAWTGFEADITTEWKEIHLHGDFQAIELEANTEAYVRRLGARFTGERHLRANQTYAIPAKVRSFEARTVSGTGKLYGSAVGM